MNTRLPLFTFALVLGAAAAQGACAGGADGAGGATGASDDAASSTAAIMSTGALMLGSSSDPTTCDDAAAAKSYLGCDFWPTVTSNPVWSIFDYAVVLANTGAKPVDVTVSGAAGQIVTTTVAPLDVAVLALPWIPALKGADYSSCGTGSSPTVSVLARKGAYHITSSAPIIAYQFSALEYRGAGGPPGKDWSSCPGDQPCTMPDGTVTTMGCFSFTNDASILLPTTAMTGAYRIAALKDDNASSFVAVTATADGTTVTLRGGAATKTLGGGNLMAIGPGETTTFSLDAGDVAQIFSDGSSDLSGSLVSADKPIQVIVGSGCAGVGDVDGATCDHLEESVTPAETLGQHYLVVPPTGPLGASDPDLLRVVADADGTTLTYPQGAPVGAPTHLDEGDVYDFGVLRAPVEIVADHEIAVATFLVSSALAHPEDFTGQGDPSQSQVVGVEQFRTSYVFLAPDDYDVNFVDVVMPLTAAVKLDGVPLPASPEAVGSSGLGVARVRIGAGKAGAHTITSNVPVGVQVIGYGSYTSYQYPAGMNLLHIAPSPH